MRDLKNKERYRVHWARAALLNEDFCMKTFLWRTLYGELLYGELSLASLTLASSTLYHRSSCDMETPATFGHRRPFVALCGWLLQLPCAFVGRLFRWSALLFSFPILPFEKSFLQLHRLPASTSFLFPRSDSGGENRFSIPAARSHV